MKISRFILAMVAYSFVSTATLAQEISLGDLKIAIMSSFTDLPQMLDAETRMDKVEVGHKEVVYYYTLVNYTFEQLKFPDLEKNLRPNITAAYCVGEPMKAFRSSDIAMLYLYYDKNHELMGTIKTNNSHCGN